MTPAIDTIRKHKERMTELEAKGTLSLAEAAEFLGISTGTLYNRLAQAKKDPSRAPRRKLDFRGQYEFDIADLKAWKRQQSETREAHLK